MFEIPENLKDINRELIPLQDDEDNVFLDKFTAMLEFTNSLVQSFCQLDSTLDDIRIQENERELDNIDYASGEMGNIVCGLIMSIAVPQLLDISGTSDEDIEDTRAEITEYIINEGFETIRSGYDVQIFDIEETIKSFLENVTDDVPEITLSSAYKKYLELNKGV